MAPRFLIGAVVAALAASCAPTSTDTAATPAVPEAVEVAPTAVEASFEMPALPDTTSDITEADLHKRVEILASDTFKGRAPGTESGEASAVWLALDMDRIGLKPAVNGAWFQNVKMVATEVDFDKSSFSISANGEEKDLRPGNDVVYWTKRQTIKPADFSDSEMVFVGFGIVAPEYDWNDYEGLDVDGKTVVMLINDPGFHTENPDLFKGKAMTYYGRWTYKFEEAARQGATGALIIHDTAPAAYGWNVVSGSWMGEQADLVREADGMDRVPLEGWISLDLGKQLFTDAGLDFDTLSASALSSDFKPVAMEGLTASGKIVQSVRKATSKNVAGMIEGASAPDEYVIYVAHWDHLGEKLNFATKDKIHNGAVDNASGTGVLLEIAEKFASQPAPARSVVFLSVTLEESGLLGSAYFAENPFIPLNKIVAGLNMDGMQPIGRSKNMVVIGSGASELEDMLTPILASQNRVATPDPQPQNGYFYRSDHISLAKKGVPMLYADGGEDLVEGGREAGLAALAAYTANDYHKPSDEYSSDWDMSGIAEDAAVFHELGRQISNSDAWPTWYEGNEFKAIREASLAEGKQD